MLKNGETVVSDIRGLNRLYLISYVTFTFLTLQLCTAKCTTQIADKRVLEGVYTALFKICAIHPPNSEYILPHEVSCKGFLEPPSCQTSVACFEKQFNTPYTNVFSPLMDKFKVAHQQLTVLAPPFFICTMLELEQD